MPPVLRGMFTLARVSQPEAKVVVAAAFIQNFTLANTHYPAPHRTKVDEPALCWNECHAIRCLLKTAAFNQLIKGISENYVITAVFDFSFLNNCSHSLQCQLLKRCDLWKFTIVRQVLIITNYCHHEKHLCDLNYSDLIRANRKDLISMNNRSLEIKSQDSREESWSKCKSKYAVL